MFEVSQVPLQSKCARCRTRLTAAVVSARSGSYCQTCLPGEPSTSAGRLLISYRDFRPSLTPPSAPPQAQTAFVRPEPITIAATARPQVSSTSPTRVSAAVGSTSVVGALLRCPFCHEQVSGLVPHSTCGQCSAPHHTACWDELQRCAACASTSRTGVTSPWRTTLRVPVPVAMPVTPPPATATTHLDVRSNRPPRIGAPLAAVAAGVLISAGLFLAAIGFLASPSRASTPMRVRPTPSSAPGSRAPAATRPAWGGQAVPTATRQPSTSAYPVRAENGDYYGRDNDGDGRVETVHVRGYYRRDGTYVRGHYRARPRR